jgi:hypothetical protein
MVITVVWVGKARVNRDVTDLTAANAVTDIAIGNIVAVLTCQFIWGITPENSIKDYSYVGINSSAKTNRAVIC